MNFLNKVKPIEELPMLLILDEHNSHIKNADVIKSPQVNYIIIISLPDHSIHKMQFLDKSFFGSLKVYYSED